MQTPRYARAWLAAGLLLTLLGMPGCQRRAADMGSVSGKVLFNGRPLPSGSLIFAGADGSKAFTLITSGTYHIENVPVGPVKVTVTSHPRVPKGLEHPRRPAPGAPPRPAGPAEEAVAIPDHYNDPERSGLTLTVRKGEQTFDINLKS